MLSSEEQAALRIQRVVRMRQSQIEMNARRAVTIERQVTIRHNDAARCIQLAFKRCTARRRKAAFRIQNWWKVAVAVATKNRMCRAIRLHCEQEYKSRAAATIQAFYRGCRDRNYTRQLRATYNLQAVGRSMLSRRLLAQRSRDKGKATVSINALLIIQRFIRRIITSYRVRVLRRSMMEDLDMDDAIAAAEQIQRFYRTVRRRQQEESASRKLQKAARAAFEARRTRQKALTSLSDVHNLQRVCRGMIARRSLYKLEYTMRQEDREFAAEIIQKFYRSSLSRRKMRLLVNSARQVASNQQPVLLLQRLGRSMLSKQRLVINNMKRDDLLRKGRNMNKSIKLLQRVGKGHRGRCRLHLLHGIVRAPEIMAADREPSPPSGFVGDELPGTSVALSPVKKIPLSSIPWRQMRAGGGSSKRLVAGPSLSSPSNRKAINKHSTTGAVMKVIDEWRTFETRHRRLTTYRPSHKSLTSHPSVSSPYAATKPRGAAYGHSVVLRSPAAKRSAFLPSLP